MKITVDVPEGSFLAWVAIPYGNLSLDPKYPSFYNIAFGSYRGQCVGSKGTKPCIVKKAKDKNGHVSAAMFIPTSELDTRVEAVAPVQDLGF